MSKVVLTVGVPGSGKSTLAKELMAQPRWAHVERDMLRMEMFGAWYGPKVDEKAVTAEQFRRIDRYLEKGLNVVISDTNINQQTRVGLVSFATERGAEIEIVHPGHEMLYDELVKRNDNEQRRMEGKVVPEHVMRSMYTSYREQFPIKVSLHLQTRLDKTPAFVFDIDGTLAEMTDRGPFEWKKVGRDRVAEDVAGMARILGTAGYDIVVLSGRDESCREETTEWLVKHQIPFDGLFMRPAGSQMKDSAVKHDLYHAYVHPRWAVHGVFDDRDQVVVTWRNMGLRCYQVAQGAF